MTAENFISCLLFLFPAGAKVSHPSDIPGGSKGLTPHGNALNFDRGTEWQATSRYRAASGIRGMKVAAIDSIHRRPVVDIGQKYSALRHMGQIGAVTLKNRLDILQHLLSLGSDTSIDEGDRARNIAYLPGEVQGAAHLDGLGVGAVDRSRKVSIVMLEGLGLGRQQRRTRQHKQQKYRRAHNAKLQIADNKGVSWGLAASSASQSRALNVTLSLHQLRRQNFPFSLPVDVGLT
ncbi:MAG: hypothetical protein ACI9SB_002298 [Candidatus Azotimanducaceae bacterium]|jgi:hypothetical protein